MAAYLAGCHSNVGNDSALTGAHFVNDTGSFMLDMGGAILDTDFVLAFKGDLELRGTPSGVSDPSAAPVTVVIAGVQPDSDVKLANSANSVEGQVHHLIYAGGTFGFTTKAAFAVATPTWTSGAATGPSDNPKVLS